MGSLEIILTVLTAAGGSAVVLAGAGSVAR